MAERGWVKTSDAVKLAAVLTQSPLDASRVDPVFSKPRSDLDDVL